MSSLSIAALALAICAGTAALASDRIDANRYVPVPRCALAPLTTRPCPGPMAPCGLTATSELPCQPKHRCWIEPWMCRHDVLGGDVL